MTNVLQMYRKQQDMGGLKQDVSGLQQDVNGLKQDMGSLRQEHAETHNMLKQILAIVSSKA